MDTVKSRGKQGTESMCNGPEAGERLGYETPQGASMAREWGAGTLGDKVREGAGADCGGPCPHSGGVDFKPA